jgi:AmmeMemoRadiSam system protein B
VLLPDVDAYSTTLGIVLVDHMLLGEVAKRLPGLTQTVVEDKEHAVEIQLPFLQRCLRDFRLVPILIERQTPDCVAALATALISSLTAAGSGERTLLVASSDLSHNHDADAASPLDHAFLEYVAELDAEGLMAAVASGSAEACGAGAVAATILAARGLGARKCQVLRYATSGDVTGDHAQVVGYSAAVLRR